MKNRNSFDKAAAQKNTELRQQLLERVSRKLVSSLNHQITLQEIAQLIVPYLADYCRIAILDNNNHIKEIAVNHTDPSKVSLAKDLYTSYKDLPNSTYGVPKILQSGKAEIMKVIDDEVLKKFKTNIKVAKIVKQMGLQSYMGVPLIARRKIIGAITFSSIKKNRYYTKEDLKFAEELARRVALTLDNMRLFNEAREELRERERIAKSLKEEQDRLTLAQDAGNIGVFELNIVKNTLTWSKQWEKMYGLEAGTFGGTMEDFMELIHHDDRKRLIKEFNKKMRMTSAAEAEFRVILPDKSVHWIQSKAQTFFNKKGKPIRTVGINIDITERKQAEINLRFLAEASKNLASSLDYQTTLNNVAKLAVPQVADWLVIDILDEKGALQQIAVTHKDPQKIKWANEIRKKYPPDLEAKTGIANILKTGTSEFYPIITEDMIKISAKDSKHFTLLKQIGFTSIMIVPLFSQKKPVGAITFISSETKRQYTNADLTVAEELAHRASLAIEHAKLYKNAQDAISLRDDFISIASHELKTPITSVKIFTQVLQKHAEQQNDQKAVKSLRKMDKQIDKLTALIYNLLNITKIQAGRLEFNQRKFSFDEMVEEIVENLQHMTKHKLILQGKTNTKIHGDEDRIGQVISNLISNSIKYSPAADKIEITLFTNMNTVGVSIRDFGIGIGKEHLNKIFNRFYRVSSTEDKTFPGLGIGLYISSEIIKRHHGKIWAESTVGKGSTFYVTLPINSTESF